MGIYLFAIYMNDISSPNWGDRDNVSLSNDIKSDLQEISRIGQSKGLKKMAQEVINLDEYTYKGQGTGRIVASSTKFPKDTVVKIAKPGKEFYNRNESSNYAIAESSIKPYLTPSLGTHGRQGKWLFAVECDEANRKTVNKIKKVLDNNGIRYDEREIVKPNLGVYNGSPCIIDYDNLF